MKAKPLEIIKGKSTSILDRLYWIASESPPKNIAKSFYFNIDDVSLSLFRTYNINHFI